MNIFFKKIFLFALFAVCFLFTIAVVYTKVYNVSLRDIPPQISDSYSYNDKIMFALNKQSEIICLGSSMSLNNIYSPSVTEYFNSNSFLNLSSWGLNIKDIYFLLKAYSKKSRPSTLVIVSNLGDFNDVEKKVDYDLLDDLLDGKNIETAHLVHFKPKYYFTNIRFSKKAKSANNIYQSLRYDQYGSVPLFSDGFQVDSARWYKRDYFRIDSTQYVYLDSISRYCNSSDIKLLFFQSPFRQGLYNTLDTAQLQTLRWHDEELSKMLGARKQHFITSNNQYWNDSLFVDGIHLNSVGAKMFTDYCLQRIRVTDIN